MTNITALANAEDTTSTANDRQGCASRASDNLDELSGDIRHLSTLIEVFNRQAIDIIYGDKRQCEQTKKEVSGVCDLLWIARDIVEQLSENSEACIHKVLSDRNDLVAEVGQ